MLINIDRITCNYSRHLYFKYIIVQLKLHKRTDDVCPKDEVTISSVKLRIFVLFYNSHGKMQTDHSKECLYQKNLKEMFVEGS